MSGVVRAGGFQVQTLKGKNSELKTRKRKGFVNEKNSLGKQRNRKREKKE